ncbi:uncharacterized protein LOC121864931 [Homarus americanus]|uniref:uncharacterized protein LOC121864931 n=1 Tax=Homarus americanus TaxID=6706 RepID=UPI001C495A1F|nr:uncharacterized protein LOC121864931 [Homarus americanus]
MTTKEKNFNIPFTGSDVFVTLKIVYSQLDDAHSHSSFAESTNNNKVYLRRRNKDKDVENVKEQQQKNLTAAALDIDAWGHLRGLVPLPPNRRVAELLIGQDCPDALTPLECGTRPDGAPFAIKTRLGWTINGPLMGNLTHRFTTECSMLTASTEKTRLEEQVRRFWEIKALHQTPGDGSLSSVEDKRVIQLWSSTGQRVEGHSQFPIPFRRQPPCLPDNRALAKRCPLGLKKRLSRDTRLRLWYKEEMEKLFIGGFAERVPLKQLSESVGSSWYLPHHPVLNPNKPDKVRIVFDCAASFSKTSLNNQVLQGSDFNNKLIGVLMWFRQEPIALMADIEEMFHQVKVNPEYRDALRFLWWEAKVQVPTRPATKRVLLAVVSSVYDPLGFICPFTIKAKLIFQDECRRKKDSDEDITEQSLHKWLRWLEDLKSLRNVKVPRCYRPGGLGCATSSQLHHFCGASQVAYAVVTYLRTVDNEGDARCSFVCGKARLAPLKQLTVPRLELCAAVLATRADQAIKREIGVPLEESLFWTDSMIVVKYIANLEKRFYTFVANRISAIHEVTEKAQWRHVRSRWNPADDATRGIPVEDMLKECRWIDGPSFCLYLRSTGPENRKSDTNLRMIPKLSSRRCH